jgi:GDP/UDP-N,N'-diacetylbacillosamine 2-epimerase (hydrolysing)
MNKTVCVITSSRADYGLLKLVIKEIMHNSHLTLKLVATGMHLSPKYGNTFQEIIQDGYSIDKKIEILMEENNAKGVSESIGLGISKFADMFVEMKPDLVLILGDRFEIFAAAIAAHVALIPIAHIHGGELTEGALDDAFRHSITKMSQLHFVSTQEYARRVIQLGEHPSRVYNTGALGIDSASKIKLLEKNALEAKLNFKFGKRNLLVTYHTVSLESEYTRDQIQELLSALSELRETHLLFTLPNADPGSNIISTAINEFVAEHKNAKVFTSLGQLVYFSCMGIADGVIGNSSSGILEAPFFRKGTVNIGERQRGRVQSESVINCSANKHSILSSIEMLYSEEFQKKLKVFENPYGLTGASRKIVEVLVTLPTQQILQKRFYNL